MQTAASDNPDSLFIAYEIVICIWLMHTNYVQLKMFMVIMQQLTLITALFVLQRAVLCVIVFLWTGTSAQHSRWSYPVKFRRDAAVSSYAVPLAPSYGAPSYGPPTYGPPSDTYGPPSDAYGPPYSVGGGYG